MRIFIFHFPHSGHSPVQLATRPPASGRALRLSSLGAQQDRAGAPFWFRIRPEEQPGKQNAWNWQLETSALANRLVISLENDTCRNKRIARTSDVQALCAGYACWQIPGTSP